MDNLLAGNETITALVSMKVATAPVAVTSAVAEKKEKEVAIKVAESNTTSATTVVTSEVTDVNAVTTEAVVAEEPAMEETSTEETVTDTGVVEGEAAADTGVVEGDIAIDTSVSSDLMAKEAAGGTYIDPGYTDGNYTEGMAVDTGMSTVKDPLLSNWVFVIGISAAVLFVSVVLGILLAKRKIKKGIELYED